MRNKPVSSTLSWLLCHLVLASRFLPVFPLMIDCDVEFLFFHKLLLVIVFYDSNRNHRKIEKSVRWPITRRPKQERRILGSRPAYNSRTVSQKGKAEYLKKERYGYLLSLL